MVWLRVYSGSISAGDVLINPRTAEAERPARLQTMLGEDATELSAAGPGAICAAVGLKATRTGDTLLLRPAEGRAHLRLPEVWRWGGSNSRGCQTRGCPLTRVASALSSPQLRTPTPVFFTAVETASASQQEDLDRALAAMQLEDPSVHVRLDQVTGQQLIGGMGELHLQVTPRWDPTLG